MRTYLRALSASVVLQHPSRKDPGGRDNPGPRERCGWLTHAREGGGDEQLVLLADRANAALWRPATAGPARLFAHARTLGEVLVRPDVGEFVEAAQFARPAGGKRRQPLARLDDLAPGVEHFREIARRVSVCAHLVD